MHVADPVTWLAISPDQRLLAIQTQKVDASDTLVETFDFATGTPLHSFAVPYGTGGLAFSADNRELAALGCCAPGSSTEVWDATSGRELFHPRLAVQVHTIAFSPTSPVLAAGTADGKILLWDTRRGAQIRAPLATAASNVLGIAFSPDGRRLVASLFNGDTLLWDLQTGQRMGISFPAMTGAITEPLFSPNGDLLINYNGVAADWPTDLGSWERYACQVAGRDLTPAEWANVLPNRPYQHVCPQ
jgi:WD40 repeat protein